MTHHIEGKLSDGASSPGSTAPQRSPGAPTHSSEVPADDVALRELVSPMPSPDALLSLQHAFGNRAVTQLLRSRTTTAGSALSTPVLQRNGKSQELMKTLVTPVTFKLQGEEIQVQDRLAQELDEAIQGDLITAPQEVANLNKQWNELASLEPTKERRAKMEELHKAARQKEVNLATYNDATYIGAIILTDRLGKTEDLVASAKLVDLPNVNTKSAKVTQSLAGGAYHLVKQRNLAPLVISNTFAAMEKAGQLEYFRQAQLPNEKYGIVIEVHYYRNRPTSSTKLHKDTRGETLFVNLSFTNKKKVLGPEYIVNPASEAIYDQFVKQKLPEVFVNDLEAVRKGLKGEKVIQATVLEENGVVAFVDEAIHHKTPTPGPRTASADRLRTGLARVYGDEYSDATTAYQKYKGASKLSLYSFRSYFEKATAKAHSDDWWKLLEKLRTLDKELNRGELKAWLPTPYFGDRAEEILEQAATDFTDVSLGVGGGKRITVPVRQRDEKPLKRQMSMEDLSQYKATASEGGKRSFFRTWVRAVPRQDLE